MKRVSYFYPSRLTKKDYRQLLRVASVYCEYFLLNCTRGDCSDDKIMLALEKYKVEEHERLMLDIYKDVDYLFKLNKETIKIILQYSSNIYEWSTQGQPEDICFLDKKKQYWFVSVVHEGYFDFLLTEKTASLLRFEYYSKLCPRKYIDIAPFSSDAQTEKLLKIIRRKSLLGYCQFITNSYELASKRIKKDIASNQRYRVLTFPQVDRLQDASKVFCSILKDNFDDEFNYFDMDIEKKDVSILLTRLRMMKKDFDDFIHLNSVQSSRYFKNCADVLEMSYKWSVERAKTSAPWDRVLYDRNSEITQKLSAELLRLSKNLEKSSD